MTTPVETICQGCGHVIRYPNEAIYWLKDGTGQNLAFHKYCGPGLSGVNNEVKLVERTLAGKVDYLIFKFAELEVRLAAIERQLTPEP